MAEVRNAGYPFALVTTGYILAKVTARHNAAWSTSAERTMPRAKMRRKYGLRELFFFERYCEAVVDADANNVSSVFARGTNQCQC